MATVIAQLAPVTKLPGEPIPYVLEAGSGRAHVLLGEVGRALVGAEESRGAMSVMSLDGPRADRPIPLHYHDNDYEFFYCLRGSVQLWANSESRILIPGDFGHIPPGTVHAYQLRSHYSTFVGPVVPGGWDRFFDLTGEPFAAAAFPAGPKGPPPFEKFARAEVEFKMKYRPDLEYEPARSDAPDDVLPTAQEAFFLRAGEGPRHELSGQLQTTLVGYEQTMGRVTMTTIEMPKGTGLPKHLHERTHEALMVLEGQLRVTLDGREQLLSRGDTASIPSGVQHSYVSEGHYTKALAMGVPGGLERLIATAGEATDEHIFSGPPTVAAVGALRRAAAEHELDVTFVA